MTDAEQARAQALELVEWFYRFAHVNEDGQCEHVLKFMATVRAEGRREGLEEKDKRIESLESTLIDVQNYASQRVAALEQTILANVVDGAAIDATVIKNSVLTALRAQLATLTDCGHEG